MNEDEEQTAVFAAIGVALTAWSAIETSLAMVFGACCGPSIVTRTGSYFGGSGTAIAVFHSTDGLSTRLNMITAAISFGFPPCVETDALSRTWDATKQAIERWSKKRNYLAHWHVLHFDNRNPGQRFRLKPPQLNRRIEHDGYTIANIEEWTRNFHRIEEDMIIPLLRAVGEHAPLRSVFANELSCTLTNLRTENRGDEADELVRIIHQ